MVPRRLDWWLNRSAGEEGKAEGQRRGGSAVTRSSIIPAPSPSHAPARRADPAHQCLLRAGLFGPAQRGEDDGPNLFAQIAETTARRCRGPARLRREATLRASRRSRSRSPVMRPSARIWLSPARRRARTRSEGRSCSMRSIPASSVGSKRAIRSRPQKMQSRGPARRWCGA